MEVFVQYPYFFLFPARKQSVVITAISSAPTIEIQIPSRPPKSGSSKTAAAWNTTVRKNEIAAETPPLFNAVKNDEPKIAYPEKRNEKHRKHERSSQKARHRILQISKQESAIAQEMKRTYKAQKSLSICRSFSKDFLTLYDFTRRNDSR